MAPSPKPKSSPSVKINAMKKFLKYTLAVIVGSLASIFLLILGFFIVVGIFAAAGKQEVQVKDSSILVLDLDGPIVERTTGDPFEELMAQISGQLAPIGLNNILAGIKKAGRDDRIKGIYLESGAIMAGHATVEEIRNALLEFKKSGKFIISFAPVYTQKSYYLASVADRIYLNPTGMLQFNGLNSQRTFYKGTLEKLGIEMQVFRHGQFKSAVEPFTRDDMSEAARLQTQTYVSSLWDHMRDEIAVARTLNSAELNHIADEMPMFKESDYLTQNRLIDNWKYKDEVLLELKDSTGIEYKDDLNAIGVKKYAKAYVADKTKGKGLAKNKIAIVYAEGEIDGTGTGGIKSDDLSRTLRKARRDSTIKAIVLRINSPGGSGLGSEIIWREVKLATQVKPVIVSMGDLAASGGYYIACPADVIVAHPNTLTGSIGVFGLIPNVKGLLNKIGITTDGVKTNRFADMPAIDRPFRPEEKELMQAYIERFYQVFLQRCASGRDTTTAAIDLIGQGRVWSGANALDIKLVDVMGGIDTALDIAAGKAGLEDYRTVEMPEILPPLEQLMKELTGNASAYLQDMLFGRSEELKVLKTINDLKSAYPVQARLPYELSIN